MSESVVFGDMEEPEFMREGFSFVGEDEKWHIKDDAPEWAKREFEKFCATVNPVPDKDGVIIQV